MAEPDARQRILEAACELIATEGVDDVRIARVATRAGASTALVHHYFWRPSWGSTPRNPLLSGPSKR